jgi:hypothetical protein
MRTENSGCCRTPAWIVDTAVPIVCVEFGGGASRRVADQRLTPLIGFSANRALWHL